MLNSLSHSSDLGLILVLCQTRIEVLPPLKEKGVAYQLEPRGELERGVLEHGLQFVSRYVFRISDFVLVRRQIDIGLDEENVIN